MRVFLFSSFMARCQSSHTPTSPTMQYCAALLGLALGRGVFPSRTFTDGFLRYGHHGSVPSPWCAAMFVSSIPYLAVAFRVLSAHKIMEEAGMETKGKLLTILSSSVLIFIVFLWHCSSTAPGVAPNDRNATNLALKDTAMPSAGHP